MRKIKYAYIPWRLPAKEFGIRCSLLYKKGYDFYPELGFEGKARFRKLDK